MSDRLYLAVLSQAEAAWRMIGALARPAESRFPQCLCKWGCDNDKEFKVRINSARVTSGGHCDS